ncbi:MAG: shikimate kinase [Candidatus Thorarchaeota archaeon]
MIEGVAKNIGLIGFMGTGKTVVGQALADRLGRQFFDTDTLVETMAGKTISQIFQDEGEASFRQLESMVVAAVCNKEYAVISFGGGVVLSKSNVRAIKESSIVVLLRASVETILGRTSSTNTRPLLHSSNNGSPVRILSLIETRRSMYESMMDLSINTDALQVDEVANEIIRRLEI